MSYRVEHKSDFRGTYEIYKVAHGFDVECFVTDFNGNIQEYWVIDHEADTDIKVDHTVALALVMPIVKSELKAVIKEYELEREELEPWSYRKLLMEPFRSAK